MSAAILGKNFRQEVREEWFDEVSQFIPCFARTCPAQINEKLTLPEDLTLPKKRRSLFAPHFNRNSTPG